MFVVLLYFSAFSLFFLSNDIIINIITIDSSIHHQHHHHRQFHSLSTSSSSNSSIHYHHHHYYRSQSSPPTRCDLWLLPFFFFLSTLPFPIILVYIIFEHYRETAAFPHTCHATFRKGRRFPIIKIMYTKTNRKRQAEKKKTTKPQITTRVGRGRELLLRRSVVAPLPTFFELKRRMAYSRSLHSLPTLMSPPKMCGSAGVILT